MSLIRSVAEARESIRQKRQEFEQRMKETCIIAVLLGAGGKGLEKRRNIEEKLEKEGILALIPEDDFAPDVAPSITEEAVLEKSDVDIIFINVESWGSATEFGQYHDKEGVAPKLRILVPYRHHPLYGTSTGYLTDLYLTHIAKYGHVYAYDDSETTAFPTSERIIMKLATRHRVLAALGKI